MEKMANQPFLSFDKRATQPLALVHTDLISPMPVELCLHAKYVLIFIDDHSSYALVVFIYNKDATAQHFQSITHWAETFMINHLPLYVQTMGGNSWAKSFKCSFHPEAFLINLQFFMYSNKTVMQRGSIELCLKKLKPYNNMLVCPDPSGKMLLSSQNLSYRNLLVESNTGETLHG